MRDNLFDNVKFRISHFPDAMQENFDTESISGLTAAAENAGTALVSPLLTSLSKGTSKRLKAIPANSKNCTSLSFVPPFVCTTMKNLEGQRILEVCIWLQSGVEYDDIIISVADDKRHLNYEVVMDKLMGNGWGLHRDLIANSHKLTKEERAMHVRVHHWNTLIDEMRNTEGALPWFASLVTLPEEVCSKKILRKSGKESRTGAKMLLVDLLLEDSKLPACQLKRSFDMINSDDDDGNVR